MLNYINGEIVDIDSNKVVVDVNGMGYELQVSANTLADCQIGQKRKLNCYMQVREDGISLFGFSTMEEKRLFMLLVSVSGVGCKVAISILGGMTANQLALAIYNGDIKQITKIKGLGKKTAERLVLELREKVTVESYDFETLPIAVNPDITVTKDMQNAIAVLCGLGKNQADAQKLVEAACKLGAKTAEEIVNMAFRIN